MTWTRALIIIALCAGACAMPVGELRAAQEGATRGRAYTPKAGSAERKALLDAVRKRLRMESQFKVGHLMTDGRWAFFRGGEVVPTGEGELQETDLSVAALLERRTVAGRAAWAVVEIWTLPTDEKQSYSSFVGRVRQRGGVPSSILPSDL